MTTEVPHSFASIPALLDRNVAQFGNKPAFREKEFGIWQSWTWAEAADEIQYLALGLLALGIERGDHVAIIGRNRRRSSRRATPGRPGERTAALLHRSDPRFRLAIATSFNRVLRRPVETALAALVRVHDLRLTMPSHGLIQCLKARRGFPLTGR